jgi:hypothetical protein
MSAATAPIAVADHGLQLIGDWEQIVARAPQLAATVDAYLIELAKTLTPASVKATGVTLRQFTAYVTAVDPHCTTVGSITGHHVGDYCLWLALHPDRRTRRTASAGTIDRRIGQLRRFFERLTERGDADAPAIVPLPARRRGQQTAAAPGPQRLRWQRSDDSTDSAVRPGLDSPPTTAGKRSPSWRRRWRRR